MHPADINAAIKKAGTSQVAIAAALGIRSATVSAVVNGVGKSKRVERAIAKIVGKPVHELFPQCTAPSRKQRAIAKARSALESSSN